MRSLHWLFSGFALAACSARAFVSNPQALADGPWGGDQIAIDVVASGADIEFECAAGRITETLKIDERGDFDLRGVFTPQSHGPERDDSSSTTQARYQGRVKGDAMTLTVVNGDKTLGPFSLIRGRASVLRKCR